MYNHQMASSGLEMNIFKLIVYNNYYAKIWPLIITFLPITKIIIQHVQVETIYTCTTKVS